MKKTVTLKSYAKVNLFLEIVGKRPDGYHDLETLFQEISLADDLTLSILEKPEIQIQTDSLDIPTDRTNLVYRAAEVFFKETGILKGVQIHLAKRIPVGGGLGGGSSNAAATLKGLEQLFSVSLPQTKSLEMAKGLGADVAFFLKGGAAMGYGIGEKLEPLKKQKSFFLILINPGFKISTADVYRSLKLNFAQSCHKASSMKEAFNQGDIEAIGENLFNRLEEPVFEKFPSLIKIKNLLKEAGSFGALLSGSGSTLFGITTDESKALMIKKVVENGLGEKCWTAVCQTL